MLDRLQTAAAEGLMRLSSAAEWWSWWLDEAGRNLFDWRRHCLNCERRGEDCSMRIQMTPTPCENWRRG